MNTRKALRRICAAFVAAASWPALAATPLDTSMRGVRIADVGEGQVVIAASESCPAASAAPLVENLRLGDLNGDGRADLLLRRTDDDAPRVEAAPWRYYAMYGRRVVRDAAAALDTDPDWVFMGLGDLNGDGADDVLLRHAESGEWHYSAMHGEAVMEFPSGPADLTDNLDWRVAAVADFDGDGNADVLLRHSVTARWFLYPMEGGNYIEDGRGIADLPNDSKWRLAGTGDLDGDGNTDVVLRHDATGAWSYHRMDGREALQTATLAFSIDEAWGLAGLGDFNGDGTDDVLLRNADGTWWYHPMDGARTLDGAGPADLTSRNVWELAGLGDLNGDGKDDVLLRHTEDGRWHYRAMNGAKSIPALSGPVSLPESPEWNTAARAQPAGCAQTNAIVVQAEAAARTCTGTAPPAPTIGWMRTSWPIVSVDMNASAYEDLVTRREMVTIPVAWSKASGARADTVRYLLNGTKILEATLTGTGAGAQSGLVTLQVTQGGKYKLEVALGRSGCFAKSTAKNLVVADTDGSHVAAITLNAGENNRKYTASTDAVVGTYFVEGSVHERSYPVDKIPAYNLTHLLYGFIPLCSSSENDSLKTISGSFEALERSCEGRQDYEVAIHDPWAAVQKKQQGHDDDTPYRGNFGQLMELKKAYPNLKVLPSIGGSTLSDPFYSFGEAANRTRFIDSVEEFLKTWKFFDGVDVDWEYPGGYGANPNLGNPLTDRDTYLKLMKELRAMLDALELETGREYELTSAISAGPDKIARVDYTNAIQYLDYLFVMTYDFYGAWSNTELGHHPGLFAGKADPSNDYNAHRGIQALLAQGVPASKIVLGVAMYGRGWTGVNAWTGKNHLTGTATGPVAKGPWEDGVWDYRNIANALGDSTSGWTRYWDASALAPYMFKSGTGDLVTYDDAESVRAKGAYSRTKGLAGLFSWEIDGDNGDILNAMQEGVGHGIAAVNRAPVARAGPDRTVTEGLTVELDASTSYDLDGDSLTYGWTKKSGPKVTLRGATSERPTFTAPSVKASTKVVFTVTVSDGIVSATDDVTVTVRDRAANRTPSANAGADQTVTGPTTVWLDASGSSDADGDTLTYAWSQKPSATVDLASANRAATAFKVAAVAASKTLTFQVSVSDGMAAATDTVTVTVAPGSSNGAPTVTLPATATVAEGATLHVTASASDPDDDTLTYLWTTGTLTATGKTTDTVSITAPQVTGDKQVMVRVTVSDGTLSATASTRVTVIDSNAVCRTKDPTAGIYPAWDVRKPHHVKGDRVSHKDIAWEAKWITAEEPVIGPTDWPQSWDLLSSNLEFPWNPERVYRTRDETNHNGRRYRAGWWTQNDDPATDNSSGVWTDIGASTCPSTS